MNFLESLLLILRVRILTSFSKNLRYQLYIILFPIIVMIIIVVSLKYLYWQRPASRHFEEMFQNDPINSNANFTFRNIDVDEFEFAFPEFVNYGYDFSDYCMNNKLDYLMINYPDNLTDSMDDHFQFAHFLLPRLSYSPYGAVTYNEMAVEIKPFSDTEFDKRTCFSIMIKELDIATHKLNVIILFNDLFLPYQKQYQVFQNVHLGSQMKHPYQYNRDFQSWERFYKSGYFYVQTLVQQAYFEFIGYHDYPELQIMFIPMKTPPYQEQGVYQGTTFLFAYPFIIMALFFIPLLYEVQEMLDDMSTYRIKRLELMGLHKAANAAAWALIVLILSLYYAGIISCIAHIKKLDGQSQFLILFFYGLTNYGSTYLISSFLVYFSLEKNAVLITIIAQIGSYLFTAVSSECYASDYGVGMTILQVIFPNVALRQGLQTILQKDFEEQQGITSWCQADFPSTAILRLFLSAILYSEIGILLKHFAKSSLSKKKFKFPSQIKNICKKRNKQNKEAIQDKEKREEDVELLDSQFSLFNQPKRTFTSKLIKEDKLIDIKNISIQQFNKSISLKFFESQIIFLCDKNGSGRDQFILNLVGIVNQQQLREVRVYEQYSAQSDIYKYHNILGFSNDFDTLFPYVGLKQYLEIFGRLKGLEKDIINQEIDEMLEIFGLQEKQNHIIDNLTQGDQYKLRLALALIGKNRFIILDMDRCSLDTMTEHKLFEYLRIKRKNKIILILSNDMEMLGRYADRFVLLKEGNIQCNMDYELLMEYHQQHYYLTFDSQTAKQFKAQWQLYQDNHKMISSEVKSGKISIFQLENESQFKKAQQVIKKIEDQTGQIINFKLQTKSFQPLLQKLIGQDQEYCDFKKAFDSYFSLKQRVQIVTTKFKQLFFLTKHFIFERRWTYWIKILLYSLIIVMLTFFNLTTMKFYEIKFGGMKPAYQEMELNYIDQDDSYLLWHSSQNTSLVDKNYSNAQQLRTFLEQWDDEMFGQYHEHYCYDNGNVSTYLGGYLPVSSFYEYEQYSFYNKYVVFANNYIDDRAIMKFGDIIYYNFFKEQIGIFTDIQGYIDQESHIYDEDSTQFLISTCSITQKEACLVSDQFNDYKFVFEIKQIFAILLGMFLFIMGDEILQKVIKDKTTDVKVRILTRLPFGVYWIAQYISDLLYTLLPILVCVTSSVLGVYLLEVNKQQQALEKLLEFEIYFVFWLFFPLYIYFITLFESDLYSARVLNYIILVGISGVGAIFLLLLTFSNYKSIFVAILVGLFPVIDYMMACIYKLQYKEIDDIIDYDTSFFTYFTQVFLIYGGWIIAAIIIYELGFMKLLRRMLFCFKCCRKHNKQLDNMQKIISQQAQANQGGNENSYINEQKQDVLLSVKEVSILLFVPSPLLVLDKVTFKVRKGECVALVAVGPNSGLSSVINCIIGKRNFSSGNFQIKAKGYGYVTQEFNQETDLTFEEMIRLEGHYLGFDNNQFQALTEFLLDQFSLEEYLHIKLRELSSDIQKKAQILFALIGRPNLIIMDEPFHGLDLPSRQALLRIIGRLVKSKEKGILFTSKSFEEAEMIADKIGIMLEGSMIGYGSLKELQNKFCNYKMEIRISIRIDYNTIEQIKSENNFKKKFKVTWKNYKDVLKNLKLDYLIDNVKYFQEAFSNRDLVLIDEFAAWAMTENFGFLMRESLKEQFQKVKEIEHCGPLFKFWIGEVNNESPTLQELVSFIDQNKNQFHIEEFAIGTPSLSSIVHRLTKIDNPSFKAKSQVLMNV